MKVIKQYNGLNGAIQTREEIEHLIETAKAQEQFHIVRKLENVLSCYPDKKRFEIELQNPEIEALRKSDLSSFDFLEEPEAEENIGLGKAVSPDDIYQMITDKIISAVKESNKSYKKKWKTQNEEGYLIPFNFSSKKPYRGINIALLTGGMTQVLKNPYFLTFNQVEKLGGKVKKGAEGMPVVYFTMLYKVDETDKNGEKINFGTYNKKKFDAWINKNKSKLKYSPEYYKNSYIPILKYYNVFNGSDVEGIDFKLKDFKIGYQDGSEVVKNNDSRIEIADLIVKNYPKPQPKLIDSKDGKAKYVYNITGSVDEVHMPKFENFETGLDYYRTLLHEFTHSTGSVKRLDRPKGLKFGDKKYAKEELVAEIGAIFLSAHAGIIWHNNSNHAAYLKSWNSALTHIEEDNRFIMRAASAAQASTDFILNYNKEGVPAYQIDLANKTEDKAKNKTDNDILSDKKEFLKYGLIGFDKLSGYKPKVKRLAENVMKQGVNLGLIEERKVKRGQGKYYPVNELESLDLETVINLIWEGTTIEGYLSQNPRQKKEYDKYSVEKFMNDLPSYEEIEQSYRGTSFRSEKRAKNDIENWGKYYHEFFNKYLDKAEELNLVEDYKSLFDYYYSKLLDKEIDLINRRKSLMSTMITGASKFPVRSQRKKHDAYNRANNDFLSIEDKLKDKISTLFYGAKVIKSGESDTVQKLKEKLAKKEELHELMKLANKALREYNKHKDVKKLEKYNFKPALVKSIVDLSKNNEGKAFRRFQLTNSNAEINRLKSRIKEELARAEAYSSGNVENDFGDLKVVENVEENRLQLLFDGKPSNEVRKVLKSSGFRWSPKNKAWQRQLTENAKWTFNKKVLPDLKNAGLEIQLKKPSSSKEKKEKETSIKSQPTKYASKTLQDLADKGLIDESTPQKTISELEKELIRLEKKKENQKPKVNKETGQYALMGAQEKKALNATEQPTQCNTPTAPVPAKSNPNSLATRMQQNANRVVTYYKIENPDIAKFLGKIEVKEKESIGISLAAPAGAGKTRFLFQVINAFAENYNVGHASIEEHPESSLFFDKVKQYIEPKNLDNIEAPEINTIQDLHELIMRNDVIAIDSFEKLREIDKNIQVDKDLRKKYDGKIFIIIFQQTKDGKMRGGSKSEFDVDIVLFTEKFPDYRENFIYPAKNRYNDLPVTDLKYSIYYQSLLPSENEEPQEEITAKTKFSNLVATPIS